MAPVKDFRIPRGVSDKLLNKTLRIKLIESQVLKLAKSWGYQLVIAAPLEFEDVLAIGAGRDLAGRSFRFDNWEDGRMIAIPPDITPQMSRISATKLRQLPYPHRLSYSGTVLRHSEVQSGQQREVIQSGVELIGSSSPEADAEILFMAISLGKAFGLKNFTINIGHVGVCKGVLSYLNLPKDDEDIVKASISLKDTKSIQQYISLNKCKPDLAEQLTILTRLFGGVEVLDKALELSWNPVTQQALNDLRHIMQSLEAYDSNIGEYVTFDLGDTRGLDYHTGITFECFAEEAGEALFAGGRYDTLMKGYGVDMPATGLTCNIGAVAKALDVQQGELDAPAAEVLAVGDSAALKELVQQLRQLGISVVTVFEAWARDQYVAYAMAHNIKYFLVDTAGGKQTLVRCSDLQEYPIEHIIS